MSHKSKIVIEIGVDSSYTADLRVRLKEYDISEGALARELGLSASHVSRWFNTDLEPRMDNVIKIEKAIAKLRAAKRRRGPANGST